MKKMIFAGRAGDFDLGTNASAFTRSFDIDELRADILFFFTLLAKFEMPY